MCDGDSRSDAGALQRAAGDLRIAVRHAGPETVLDGLRQAGCLKGRFPRRIVPGWMDAVMLNTGGGVAGGDRLEVSVEAGAGARVVVAAQAAERFYRARPGDPPSVVRTRLLAGAGSAIEWLPQETILFDRCALDRRLEIDLAADARFLGVETLVFGRAAMGEQVRTAWLRDLIRVRRSGQLLWHDAIRLDGAVAALMARRAIGAGAAAMATIVHVAPDADALLAPVRDALAPAEAGASVWNGMMVARILGSTGAGVRSAVVAALDVLRAGRPLPRVWLC